MLRSARILRRVLETCEDSSERPSANADVKNTHKEYKNDKCDCTFIIFLCTQCYSVYVCHYEIFSPLLFWQSVVNNKELKSHHSYIEETDDLEQAVSLHFTLPEKVGALAEALSVFQVRPFFKNIAPVYACVRACVCFFFVCVCVMF